MIIVDGRTDKEKLLELLIAGEQDELDFKAELDLKDPKSKLNFVKDLVALANTSHGGYIIIGADDGGKPSLPTEDIDHKKFDVAKINDILNKYINVAECKIISQFHEINEHGVFLVFSSKTLLPIPFTINGEYPNEKGKSEIVFHQGSLWTRENSQNCRVQSRHWPKLLEKYRESIQAETRKDMDALLHQLSEAGVVKQTIILEPGVDNKIFGKSVAEALSAQNISVLNRAIVQFKQMLQADSASSTRALHKLTILAVEALMSDNKQIVDKIVEAMHDRYLSLSNKDGDGNDLLDLAVCLYIIGSMAVRTRNWSVVRDIALKPGHNNMPHYRYSSWIRNIQVEASRKNLFNKDDTGMLISLTRKLMSDMQEFRPDILGDAVKDTVPGDDAILNSLCQFDFLYCIWVYAEGKHRSGAYPSFAAFYYSRIKHIVTLMIDDRGQVFPDLSAEALVAALEAVISLATQEASKVNGLGSFDFPDDLFEQIAKGSDK